MIERYINDNGLFATQNSILKNFSQDVKLSLYVFSELDNNTIT